jgi:hypothetical protein
VALLALVVFGSRGCLGLSSRESVDVRLDPWDDLDPSLVHRLQRSAWRG